jgi:mRNA interferase RelE/StbE
MYRLFLARPAQRFFEHADAGLQRRLDRCFAQLRLDPRALPSIRALKGRYAGCLRHRIGDYRVVYRVNDTEREVIVEVIAHRREAYD